MGRTAGLIILTLLFGFGELAFISDNIVFDKVNTVTTTRSKWLVTFIIDLKPFEGFLNRISHDMVKSSALAQTVLRRYEQPGKEHFYNTFSNLEQEFNLLMDMHRSITDSFDDFKTLHRHRRSVLPFIGSAMSFLFGTLTEDDINLIKGNVRTLAQNQKKISHILTENLSILNITRLEVLSFSYYVNIEKKLPCSAKRGSGCKMQNVAPKYDRVSQLVSAKTEGDVNTSRDVPSAPMLDNSKEEVANNLYPLLKLAEQTVRI
ncbi:unnamed protein product [Mytilus coruscus]|nr:unnamed protein product [Mytilus coruscus]